MPTSVLAPSTDPVVNELLKLSQQLLDAIAAGDWDAYRSLVAEDVTCFEAEAAGHLVQGLPFHEFYFKLGGGKAQPPKQLTTTMVAPKVRLLGDAAALVAYVRLVQKLDADGRPITVSSQETRLWHKVGGRWLHVHFHRS